MSKKVCKSCKRIYEKDACPNCGGTEYTDTMKGKIIVVNPEKSEIAKQMKFTGKGEFAMRVR